jgi:hypothetical protein
MGRERRIARQEPWELGGDREMTCDACGKTMRGVREVGADLPDLHESVRFCWRRDERDVRKGIRAAFRALIRARTGEEPRRLRLTDCRPNPDPRREAV